MAGVLIDGRDETGPWPDLSSDAVLRNWRNVPPVLRGCGVTLKEVEVVEAVALYRLLSHDEIAEVIAPPPSSPAELAARIEAARIERLDGRGICFTLVHDKETSPAGLFRVREMERGFGSAEWEFVLAPQFWGGGLFFVAAPPVIDFAFDVLGVTRLEARVSVGNGRGNGALRKIGAVQEGVLRQSLQQEKGWVDQALWTLLRDDWRRRTGKTGPH
jgi:ribosomal-protein-alanine N-acetyltransferase